MRWSFGWFWRLLVCCLLFGVCCLIVWFAASGYYAFLSYWYIVFELVALGGFLCCVICLLVGFVGDLCTVGWVCCLWRLLVSLCFDCILIVLFTLLRVSCVIWLFSIAFAFYWIVGLFCWSLLCVALLVGDSLCVLVFLALCVCGLLRCGVC